MKQGYFYSCGCADNERGGIYYCHETADGHIVTDKFTALKGANYVCFSPNRKNLYSTENIAKCGLVAAYAMNEDGTLTSLNDRETLGAAACHLSVSPDGKFLYVVNYSSGNFAEIRLNEDGSIADRLKVVSHTSYPVGPRTDRQEQAHTHCTRFTPDGKYLCIVDLGVDRVFLYPFTAGQGIGDTPRVHVTDPADGPRHILFDASGKVAYIINELGNSVTALTYSDGVLTKTDKFTTLPEGCTATTKASAIRFSPDGRFLYASNRGFDSIACYKVLAPGKLELFDIVDAHGVSPRDINFLPSGRYFTASNEFSDVICLYSFDAATGKISYLEGHDVTDEPRPLCIEYF